MATRNYQLNKRRGSKRPRMKDIGSGKYKRQGAKDFAVRLLNRAKYFKYS